MLAFLTIPVQAITASEVFEIRSRSIVVVIGLDQNGNKQSQGSGVILPGGGIATNCHVIDQSRQFVVLHQGNEYQAAIRHTDWDRDVCTLTTQGLTGLAAELGSTSGLKVGAKVYAIGAPRGLELTFSEGIVSSLRMIEGGQHIQITAPISPGSSGGGLFDEGGRLIGLPTFYLSEGQQLNFAVPVEWVLELPLRHESARPSATTSVEWLTKSITLEKKQALQAFLQHAKAWTKAQPDSAAAWFSLANAFVQLKQANQAIAAYKQALSLDPADVTSWYNIGVVYAESGHFPDAKKAFEQSLSINPEHAKSWSSLGALLEVAGQPSKAIEYQLRALRIDPGLADAWHGLGNNHYRLNEYSQAIDAYKEALRIAPERAGAWHGLGMGLLTGNDAAKAITAFEEAIRLAPDEPKYWLGLGVAHGIEGQRSKVMEIYRRLKTMDPTKAETLFKSFIVP